MELSNVVWESNAKFDRAACIYVCNFLQLFSQLMVSWQSIYLQLIHNSNGARKSGKTRQRDKFQLRISADFPGLDHAVYRCYLFLIHDPKRQGYISSKPLRALQCLQAWQCNHPCLRPGTSPEYLERHRQ